MEDPRPLEGMARSIDDLFSDAERRRVEPFDEGDEDGDVQSETGAAPAAEAGPADAPDPVEAEEEGDAEAARASTEEALERARRKVDDVVGSADLLDDVEVIEPRTAGPPGPPRPEPIDIDIDEDPEELVRAAAWTPERPPAGRATEAPSDPAGSVDAAETPDAMEAPEATETPEAPEPQPTADAEPPALDGESPAEPPALETGLATPAAEPRGPDAVALRARALARAVEAFLDADPGSRGSAADGVREAVADHREAREVDAPADAVERLSLAASGGAVELAREIAVPAVASRVVVRLGMAREEDRRAELLRVTEILGSAVAPALADALSQADDRSARRNFVEALVRLGQAGLREAEAMLADPRWWVVRNGVSILGEVGGERAVEHLTSTLAHEDARVRRETLMGLARVGGENAGILATGMLEDPDAEVRAAAAMAVGELKVERAQRTLQAMLESEGDEDALVEVLRALGRLGDPGAVPAIEKKAVGTFFSRPPTAVREAAFRALAAIGTPHAREVLEAAVDDRDPDVQRLARELVKDR